MPKKPVTEIGRDVPRTLKFGIIVTVAIFWATFLRSWLHHLFASTPEWMLDFFIALVATVVSYVLFLSYRKVRSRLKKIKVDA